MSFIKKYLGMKNQKVKKKIKLNDNGSFVVGRGEANDIVIKVPYISRRHLVIYKMMEAVYVEDAGSTCGTFLNGKRIMWAQVVPGDTISIKNVKMTFLDSEIIIEVPKSDAHEWEEKIVYVEPGKERSQMQLPERISLFESRNIFNIQQLNVWENWTSNVADRSLIVPMGICDTGEICEIDLVKDGNLLIHGMGYSGRTETLLTLMLSIAMKYSPRDVSFLWVDHYYKGANAQFLENLIPHLIGTISEMNSNMERFIHSMKAELERRMQILRELGLHNMGEYIKGYHEGKYEEPIARLVFMVDDANGIKHKSPELYKMLLNMVMLGRGLGIHVCFAVENDIWFQEDDHRHFSTRIQLMCFRNEMCSHKLFGHKCGELNSKRGRGYIQKGWNEDTRLVQFYWCEKGHPKEYYDFETI